jgi:protein gp37
VTWTEWSLSDIIRPVEHRPPLRNEIWNPTTGCDRISPGCDRCYALFLAESLKERGDPHYQRDGDPRTSGPGFGLTVHEEALEIPHRWKGSKTVYVNTMSDLFHKDVPLAFLQRIFHVMGSTPQHTYHVLTKRSKRLVQLAPELPWHPNVCMGVSVESDVYTYRADHLRKVPARARFLQLEPLLGPLPSLDLTGISWAVVGRENGPGARPMRREWVDEIRERCRETGAQLIEPNFNTVPLSDVDELAPAFGDA